MYRKILVLALVLAFCSTLMALTPTPVIGPNSPMPATDNAVPYVGGEQPTDYVGEVYLLGTTWYDYQHNGTTSTQIALDSQGNVQMVWMNGMQELATERNIYFNMFTTSVVFPVGIQVNVLGRSGYTTFDLLPDGRAGAFYHATIGSGSQAVFAQDVIYGAGVFLETAVPLAPGIGTLVWPHGVVDNQGYIHVVAQENPNTQVYYSRSEDGGYTFSAMQPIPVSSGMVAVSHTMAASPVSNKVAIGYTNPIETSWIEEDVFYIESDDGVTWNFGSAVNITNFGLPGHPMTNEVRAWSTVNMMYDANGQLHIAYTTLKYPSTALTGESILWHWSEATGNTKICGEMEFGGPYAYNDPGGWHSCWDLACLGMDANGVLYSTWEQCTTPGDVSAGGYGNWDVYVAYSEDNGASWMAPVNVTDTPSPGAVAGDCMSEGWPTSSRVVDDYVHIIYIEDKDAGGVVQTEGVWTENPAMYQRVPVADIQTDLTITLTPENPPIVIPAAGGSFDFNVNLVNNSDNQVIFDGYIEAVVPTGTSYLCLLREHLVISGGGSISRDLTQNVPGGAPAGDYTYRAVMGDYGWSVWADASFDFTKSAFDNGSPIVGDWNLEGWDTPLAKTGSTVPARSAMLTVSPNPFNPTAEISFNLENAGNVKLSVYDITGRQVAVLVNGYINAGSQNINWNAGNLPSGIYFFELNAGNSIATSKALLLK